MYKLSAYNYLVPYDEKIIYLNGISQQVFSLTLKEHKKMQEYFEDLISFEINYTSVFNQLKNWGFIVPEEFDEVEIIRFRHRKAVFMDKDYRLIINPTLECNFKCWYCYEDHVTGHMEEDTINRIRKHILYMAETKKISSLYLGWFGGEPLLYFDEVIYPISLYAKKVCEENRIPFHNSITTNLSRLELGIIDKMKEVDLNGFQVTLDGDKERHDKVRNENGEPSFDKIIHNLLMICKEIESPHIVLRINYDNQTLKRSNMRSVLERIPLKYRDRIEVDLQRVWQTVESNKTENAERIMLYESCDELGFGQFGIGNNIFTMNKAYKCYVDRYYHAEINYDGKVYRCTARGYDDKYVVGALGEDGVIRWDGQEMALRYSKAPFENPMCLKCKYLPLCLGPCSQRMVECNSKDLDNICHLNRMDIKPNTIIIDYYNRKMKLLKQKEKHV